MAQEVRLVTIARELLRKCLRGTSFQRRKFIGSGEGQRNLSQAQSHDIEESEHSVSMHSGVFPH